TENQMFPLFVGGLSANTDDDGLRQHFERFGELIDHVVIKHKVQSRSRCFGFVTYAKPEQADAAMAAIPHTVDGTAVEVKRAVAKEKSKEKIFVGGLKNDIFEFHLTQYFSQYGQVEKSEIMLDMVTGRNRGFGFVHFTNPSAADKAALVKFHKVNAHRVEVKKALTKQEMQGEDATTQRVMGGNQNGYRGSHGAGYYDQGSSYGGYTSYGNDARFYDNGGYSGTYTCGHCGHENLSGGWNVYNGYGQSYSGYGPNNSYFGGQSTAPYTGGCYKLRGKYDLVYVLDICASLLI
uniref:RRM domain-containing protein n=1 Tax=Oryzias melastigma TaxID=30732 RepID=A0A3B3CY41_ORYME